MALERYLAEEVALDCAEGLLSRREALRRLALLGLTLPAASALLAACGSGGSGGAPTTASTTAGPASTTTPTTGSTTAPTTATAAAASSVPGGAAPGRTLPPGQPIRFPGTQGELQGVLALPAGTARGGVLVIHENRGLTPHIASIPPRLAADGFAALAIDLLSEEGGTASLGGDAQATAALGKAPAERMIADLRSGLDELARRAPGAKLGVTGFCFGGGMTWQLLAAGEPRLAAAVPFYGPSPANPSFTGSPNAAVLAVYAGQDDRVNAGQATVEAALAAAGLEHEKLVYAGADHAFFNDTGPRFNAQAATQAYAAMISWFGRHLGA